MRQTNKANKADLTHKQDLSIAVMNLISLEEHLAFTAMKTQKQDYVEILVAIRKMRITLLEELVVNREGELWCISKHLLSATMRLMETATKYAGKDNAKALEFHKQAFDLYGLFWLLQQPDTSPELKQERSQQEKKQEKKEKPIEVHNVA